MLVKITLIPYGIGAFFSIYDIIYDCSKGFEQILMGFVHFLRCFEQILNGFVHFLISFVHLDKYYRKLRKDMRRTHHQ
jgi:hypothetical protein